MADKAKRTVKADFEAGTRYGQLLDKHGTAMVELLPPATKEGLAADLNAMQGVDIAASVAKANAKGATGNQNAYLDDAALKTSSCREAIKRTFPKNKALQATFGVGAQIQPRSVKSVSKNLSTAIEAARKYPEEAREAAITPTMVEQMTATLSALLGADQTQIQKKGDAKDRVAERREAQLRVERTLDRIYAVATMVFMGKPELKEFQDALARPSKAAKKKDAPTPEPITD